MALTPGTNIGPYRIIEQLGQGGMATVYKAYHAALDRYVAIKAMHPAFKEDPTFHQRFQREARIVAKLDHPNIVPIYDFGEYEETPYLVMRFVQGQTLKALLRAGPPTFQHTLEISRPVADALDYAHAQGILHRDIKPSNIILSDDQHVYLTDFGLARIAAAGDSTLSQDMLMGTPQYISPEQARGEPVDVRSDIYSFGVVLFELFTGRVPFNADTPYAVVHDHIYTPLPLPSALNPQITPEIERVLLKALAKDHDARFATVRELMSALESAVRPEIPVSLPGPGTAVVEPSPGLSPDALSTVAVSAPSRAGPRVPGWVWLIAGVVLTLLVVAFLIIIARPSRPALRMPTAIASPQIKARTPAVAVTVAPPGIQITTAQTSVAANPNDARAYMTLGDAYRAANQPNVALLAYNKATELDPQLAEAYLAMGALFVRLNALDRAANVYMRAVQNNPDNVDLRMALGDVYYRQEAWEKVKGVYEGVIAKNPASALAYARLGDYYYHQSQYVEATKSYTRALEIDSTLPEAHFGLGLMAEQRRLTEQARREFTVVVNSPRASDELRAQAQQHLDQLK